MKPTWTDEELTTIRATHEVELTTFRPDGTPRKPVTVWVVRNGDDLYIRSWRGRTAAWFRAAQARHEGLLNADGMRRKVVFLDDGQAANDRIDMEYRAKYGRVAPAYVEPMVGPEARATTLRIVPST